MSALAKLPMLFTSSLLFHFAMSPPHEPPKKSDTTTYDDSLGFMSVGVGKIMAKLGKALMWGYSACEAAVILSAAGKLPSEYANTVLKYLVRPGFAATSVRITGIGFRGWLLFCAGCALRLVCHRALGSQFTWELAVTKNHRLVTTGPYAIVRHPSYTGVFVSVAGATVCYIGSGTWAQECGWLGTTGGKVLAGIWLCGMFAVPPGLVRRAKKEDEALKRQFGEKWDAYAKKTPYVLMPYIY